MTAISKNVYFDVLDDIVDKYNNTVHRTIKKKPIDVTSDSYAEHNKGYTPNWSEEVLLLIKLKIQFLGLILLMILMVKKLNEVFTKKNCKKLMKKNLEQKKYLKEKVIKCLSNGKVIIIILIVGLIKKTLYKNE